MRLRKLQPRRFQFHKSANRQKRQISRHSLVHYSITRNIRRFPLWSHIMGGACSKNPSLELENAQLRTSELEEELERKDIELNKANLTILELKRQNDELRYDASKVGVDIPDGNYFFKGLIG